MFEQLLDGTSLPTGATCHWLMWFYNTFVQSQCLLPGNQFTVLHPVTMVTPLYKSDAVLNFNKQ